jgi:werner syndrome ATP-dependent helicase
MYDKRDCCVIASTGFGKSLIYQYPPVYLDKLVVVISPLCALMLDQVISLKDKGIKACFFGSQQPDKSLRMVGHNVVFITPEFFVYGSGKSLIAEARHKIIFFAIDEAHVIDQWGDFRVAYRHLGDIKDCYPNIPIVCLTATAPQYVENIITKSLKLRNFHRVKTALDRPNLEFTLKHKSHFMDNYGRMPDMLEEMFPEISANKDTSMRDVYPLLKNLTEGSAIVYCLTQKMTEFLSKRFNDCGLETRPYHSKLKSDFKDEVVKDFKSNKLKIVICTIAFGMGIDKPDVRLVIHYGVPKSLEAYYQEAGRAGRDGNPSKCILFYDEDDYGVLNILIGEKRKDSVEESYRQQQIKLLARVRQFISGKQCRRLEVLNYLGTTPNELEKITIREDCCDNCKFAFNNQVPPEMKYDDVNHDGTYDFTQDARIALTAIDKKLLRVEVTNLIVGELPTARNFRSYKLKVFGIGREKSKDWWNAIISLLVNFQFIELVGNTLRLNKKAKRFLRFQGTKMILPPNRSLLTFMKKKENVEFYWENGNIKSRPKRLFESSQKSSAVLSEDAELDEDDDFVNEIFDDAVQQAQTAQTFGECSKTLSNESNGMHVDGLQEPKSLAESKDSDDEMFSEVLETIDDDALSSEEVLQMVAEAEKMSTDVNNHKGESSKRTNSDDEDQNKILKKMKLKQKLGLR